MRILNVSHYYTPHVGGLERVASMQVQSQSKEGHTVSVITCASKNEKVGKEIIGNVSIFRTRVTNITDTLFSIPFPIGGIGLISTLWREVKSCDVVHVHDVFYQPSWLAYFFAQYFKKPIVLTQHVCMVDHPSKFVMGIERLVYNTVGKKIFNYADTIVAYNPQVRDFLISHKVKSDKVLLMPNGIDTANFKPSIESDSLEIKRKFGLPTNRPLVLFVGRFVPKKGYDILYESRDDKFDLVFVGSGKVPDEWLDNPKFHFLGARSQKELAELYSVADLFVSPTTGEIFTLVMQEAMASGLPVISSYEKGYDEFDIDRSLLILCERSKESLKENILNVLDNKDLHANMTNYSLLLSKKLCDWDDNVFPLLNVYKKFEKNKTILVTTSWDDGHILDIKLANLLKKYGVKGTFYISPEDREFNQEDLLTDEDIRTLNKDFEVGAHTMTHRHLTTINIDEAKEEIVGSKKYLEEVIGDEVKSFCYPAGHYSHEHLPIISEVGFTYARTVDRFSFTNSVVPYEVKTSIHTYNHYSDAWDLLKFVRFNPFVFLKLFLHWDRQAILMFDQVYKYGGVFHLWGHSWEVDKQKDWMRLEKVLAHIGRHNDVIYVTNSEQLTYDI